MTLKVGHYWPASETPLKWRAEDGPPLNAGGSFVIFRGS